MSLDNKMDNILREVCRISEETEIIDSMSSSSIIEWDSMANMELVVKIEEVFEVQFSFEELIELENWGNYKAAIKKKLKKD